MCLRHPQPPTQPGCLLYSHLTVAELTLATSLQLLFAELEAGQLRRRKTERMNPFLGILRIQELAVLGELRLHLDTRNTHPPIKPEKSSFR